jgi:hypothetical protein
MRDSTEWPEPLGRLYATVSTQDPYTFWTFQEIAVSPNQWGIQITEINVSQTIDTQWTAQGPSPVQNGQVENVSPDNEVIGAIHTVVAPTNPDIL